jgi:arabinogalactan oligomer/maltooligosaccharide transport system substrate-binding protein
MEAQMKIATLIKPLMLATVFALVLGACGGGATPVAEEPEVVEEATAAPAEEEPVAEATENLVLWVYDDGRLEVLTQLGAEFEEEFGVGLTVEVVDLTELRNAMALGAAAGEGPDMVIIPHDNLGPMVENGSAAEIDLGDKAAEFLPNAIDGFTYNGALYGVPLAVENIGFFRNTDLVPNAPATWAEVQEIGAALMEAGSIDQVIEFPDLTYNTYPLYTSYGGYIFGRDAEGNFTTEDIGINNEGMAAGLAWVKELVDAGLVSPNVDWEASHVRFETGRAAFIMTGPWAINRFQTAGVPYAISAFPAAEAGGEAGYPFLGVQGLVVNANNANALLAQTFAVDFLATEEHYAAIFAAEPRPSAWATIFASASDPDTAGFNEAGVNAVPMPAIPAMGYVWDAWVNAGALVLSGELSPAEALQQAVDQVLAQVESNG